jgi:hypothetical protein
VCCAWAWHHPLGARGAAFAQLALAAGVFATAIVTGWILWIGDDEWDLCMS